MTSQGRQIAGCSCGRVELEVLGEPIVATVCHCSSCREAGRRLGEMPGAAPVLDTEGGTPLVLYRKDRVRCTRGSELLAEHRLKAESPTRRVVATCCNAPMFLDFTKGHWISIYEGRLPADGPAAGRRSGLFVLRLMWAWAAMAFRTPKIDWVKGRIDGLESR